MIDNLFALVIYKTFLPFLTEVAHPVQHGIVDQGADVCAPHKVHVVPQNVGNQVQETQIGQGAGQQTGIDRSHHPVICSIIQMSRRCHAQQVVEWRESGSIGSQVSADSVVESAEQHRADYLSEMNHLAGSGACGGVRIDHRQHGLQEGYLISWYQLRGTQITAHYSPCSFRQD